MATPPCQGVVTKGRPRPWTARSRRQASNDDILVSSSVFPVFPSCLPPPRVPLLSPLFPSPFPPPMSLQIETYRLMFRANARARTDHGADIVSRPPHFSGGPNSGSRVLGPLSRTVH
ncbi:hypothetical protein H8959_020956 [Pygathrix nigripes]